MDTEDTPNAITAVSVKGFKSFAEEQRVEIRPLTILAGANSSGKSSALQPLLLLKQTVEATYDPGPLLLDGPNVKFSSAKQLLSRLGEVRVTSFQVSVESSGGRLVDTFREEDYSFGLAKMHVESVTQESVTLEPGMTESAILKALESGYGLQPEALRFSIERDRCFLLLRSELKSEFRESPSRGRFALVMYGLQPLRIPAEVIESFAACLSAVIHVPGLRGNPERSYRTTAVEDMFPGTFDNYVASVISSWQKRSDPRLDQLDRSLESLGLTWKVTSNQVNATQVELLIGRLPRRGEGTRDLINIADVGFGVSQVLPVIVALLTARRGQLVYIEQPELHLHPRAQQALAQILADAARRGVRVVAETHSSTLLLAVQSLIAEGQLDSALVRLHWFQRDERGATQIHSADLDENGAYGDWPEDFGEVRAEVENRYLNAVEARAFSRPAAKRARTKKK